MKTVKRKKRNTVDLRMTDKLTEEDSIAMQIKFLSHALKDVALTAGLTKKLKPGSAYRFSVDFEVGDFFVKFDVPEIVLVDKK